MSVNFDDLFTKIRLAQFLQKLLRKNVAPINDVLDVLSKHFNLYTNENGEVCVTDRRKDPSPRKA